MTKKSVCSSQYFPYNYFLWLYFTRNIFSHCLYSKPLEIFFLIYKMLLFQTYQPFKLPYHAAGEELQLCDNEVCSVDLGLP